MKHLANFKKQKNENPIDPDYAMVMGGAAATTGGIALRDRFKQGNNLDKLYNNELIDINNSYKNRIIDTLNKEKAEVDAFKEDGKRVPEKLKKPLIKGIKSRNRSILKHDFKKINTDKDFAKSAKQLASSKLNTKLLGNSRTALLAGMGSGVLYGIGKETDWKKNKKFARNLAIGGGLIGSGLLLKRKNIANAFKNRNDVNLNNVRFLDDKEPKSYGEWKEFYSRKPKQENLNLKQSEYDDVKKASNKTDDENLSFIGNVLARRSTEQMQKYKRGTPEYKKAMRRRVLADRVNYSLSNAKEKEDFLNSDEYSELKSFLDKGDFNRLYYLANFNENKFWKRASDEPIVKGQLRIGAKNDPDYGKYRTRQGVIEKTLPVLGAVGVSALATNAIADNLHKKYEKEGIKEIADSKINVNERINSFKKGLNAEKKLVKLGAMGLPSLIVGGALTYSHLNNKYSPFYKKKNG